jgi:hypothetical protein
MSLNFNEECVLVFSLKCHLSLSWCIALVFSSFLNFTFIRFLYETVEDVLCPISLMKVRHFVSALKQNYFLENVFCNFTHL